MDSARNAKRRRCTAALVAAVMVAAGIVASDPAAAAVILTEVLYDPQNADTDREWIEIFNTGTAAVDLSGWQFGRPNASQWTSAFPTGTTLAANQALAVTSSAATFDADWGTGKNRIQVSNFPSLPNDPASASEGRIAIRNQSAVIQDEISYRNTSGWPNINGNDGHSIYLLPQHLSDTANDSGGNWRPASQGVYGAYWRGAGGDSENHASPAFVSTTPQTPFTPSSDAAWSMVILPDTQNYVARDQSQLNILHGQMNWIVANKAAFNIQVVLQEGDIVNRNSGTASNGVTAVEQWERARDAFSTLNGVVPYVMSTGNHDYGTTSGQTRDTKFNTYFKATDNPLVNPATGGILKGTMVAGELQNAYYDFTAPDGRQMLIFSLECWPRDNVVAWAKSVAQQPQYADHTAALLTHSIINSGDDYWRTSDDAYEMEGGNDGLDLWNKLLDVSGNFEMTFNGHIGGDGVGYRVDQSNAGDDVHQMLINAQFETNAGNGWLRVLEFLEDGHTVRVRTYSPHFNLYRTNAANQFSITLSQVTAPTGDADFDADGDVDGADFLTWQRGFGAARGATAAQGDANGDGAVDRDDFNFWKTQFGTTGATSATTGAPEPTSAALALLALVATLARSPRRTPQAH